MARPRSSRGSLIVSDAKSARIEGDGRSLKLRPRRWTLRRHRRPWHTAFLVVQPMSLFRDVEDLMATLQEEQEDNDDEVKLEEEALLAMTSKDLKALAKELGVGGVRGQSKAAIVASLLEQAGRDLEPE